MHQRDSGRASNDGRQDADTALNAADADDVLVCTSDTRLGLAATRPLIGNEYHTSGHFTDKFLTAPSYFSPSL